MRRTPVNCLGLSRLQEARGEQPSRRDEMSEVHCRNESTYSVAASSREVLFLGSLAWIKSRLRAASTLDDLSTQSRG